MAKYTPHSQAEKDLMLKKIGVKSIDDLYKHVPKDLKLSKPLNLPKGVSQFEAASYLEALSKENKVFPTILRGAGAYNHLIPAPVRAISSREEFVTTYTPYQAEVSQGILQSIFEYQSMMCELTGLEVSNASVYDVACAAAEAMIVCCDKKNTVVLAGELNPQVVDVVKTYAFAGNNKVVKTPSKNGLIDADALIKAITDDTACVIAANPNYFGLIEDMDKVAAICKEKNVKFVYQFSPIACALMKSPGEVGADIAIGEGQPLGMPLSFGGPYLGIMTCTNAPAMLRRLPGRIVGQTEEHITGDRTGERGFVMTLQAREQHIRREKSLSSICSNQALCALTASIYLACMGPEGLKEVATACTSKAHYFAKQLTGIKGVSLKYDGEFFHEFVTVSENVDKILKALEKQGILGGLKVGKNEILWCVTEAVSKAELDKAAAIVKGVTA